jgi:hypothetical protein
MGIGNTESFALVEQLVLNAVDFCDRDLANSVNAFL